MGDYIRGKKAYTKWDADSENIDIEYRPDGQKKSDEEGWLSGTKGKIIKVLLVLMVFCLGLLAGFFFRRGIREIVDHSLIVPQSQTPVYSFSTATLDKLLTSLQANNIKEFLRNYTSDAHIAGKASSKKYIQHVRELWQSWGIENVHLEKFKVLLSYPSSDSPNKVHLITSKDNSTREIASESGDDALHPDLRPYLAYSPNKTAEGKLIYVNYGQREDFEYLATHNINITGCIAIMRMGKIHQANKVKFAEEFGAIGVLLYPDPFDYVNRSAQYPDGLGLPGSGVIRGTLNLHPGDLETPLQASTATAARNPNWQIALPRIPVQPISSNNALKFMRDLGGPEAPEVWKGDLNMKYNIGPGHNDKNLIVSIDVCNEVKQAEIYNILGMIRGKFEPDRYIIFGNHHDSWTNGTGDPGTGLAAFLEMIRGLAQLHKEGWQPGRTLVFACWDAEEFGMMGSTEWLELHERELASRAVAYINTDGAVEGTDTLEVLGSPLLTESVVAAAKSVVHLQPDMHTALQRWLPSLDTDDATPQLGILSSSSDYVGFMNMQGISSLHLKFSGSKSFSKLAQSAFDNYDAFAKFVDPDFRVSLTMSQLLGALALQLSDNLKLPMNAKHYGLAVKREFDRFKEQYGADLTNMNNVTTLYLLLAHAADEFQMSCNNFHNNFNTVTLEEELLAYHEYNDRAMELERSLLRSNWELYRLYHRHAIFGPHPYNINEGIAFPQLVDSILQTKRNKDPALVTRVRFELSEVIARLNSASDVLISSILDYKNLDSEIED